MIKRKNPGVSRDNRQSDEGLQRLEKQLAYGAAISRPVLEQWIRRYGDDARKIIERYTKPAQ
ncbi:MAG: hypothetical protein V3W04_09870 [Gammaproteobacteria bacterium]